MMTLLSLLLLVGILFGIIAAASWWKGWHAQQASKRLIGKQAPDFALPDETNTMRSLREFRGKKIVLYFYPKDDTPGCTKQACSFRDQKDSYTQHNLVVIGVSYDTPASHASFKEKYHLPFILLSDTNKKVARLYGAQHGFGPEPFPRRITFLINEQGMIVDVLDKIDNEHHAGDVLKAFHLI